HRTRRPRAAGEPGAIREGPGETCREQIPHRARTEGRRIPVVEFTCVRYVRLANDRHYPGRQTVLQMRQVSPGRETRLLLALHHGVEGSEVRRPQSPRGAVESRATRGPPRRSGEALRPLHRGWFQPA